MVLPDSFQLLLIAVGAALMLYIVLNAIGQTAQATASDKIAERRAAEERRRAENAAAEAAGRAAALEPLALNPDGTIEEPVIGIVERVGV